VKRYAIEAEIAVEADVEAAFDWDHPFGYQDLRSGIRRVLARRFPYAVYFSVEGETIAGGNALVQLSVAG
jgi:hypothetical protein